MFKLLAGGYMVFYTLIKYGDTYTSNPDPTVDLCLFLGFALIAISLDNKFKK